MFQSSSFLLGLIVPLNNLDLDWIWSRHPAGAEGRSDVKATRVGVDIQYLTSKVEASDQFTFQSFRIDFLETDATFCNKGFS